MSARQFGSLALLTFMLAATAGCRGGTRHWAERIGDPARGREMIATYECGVCHAIPGVRGARGVVGPTLEGFARQLYIAGQLPNTPQNLVRWVRDPSRLAPWTAMPNVGLDEHQARDVAAYLYTLG